MSRRAAGAKVLGKGRTNRTNVIFRWFLGLLALWLLFLAGTVYQHHGMVSEGLDRRERLSSLSLLPRVATPIVDVERRPGAPPVPEVLPPAERAPPVPAVPPPVTKAAPSIPVPAARPAAIVDFERQPGVAIVTKIHGPHQFHLLEQSLCLLHHAYNRRVRYDIVVFTTLPLSAEEMATVRNVTRPARVTFPLDNRGTIQAEIAALSPVRRAALLARCRAGPDNITHVANITWWSNCPDRLAYNWQAEFRGWHLWRHAALRDYRYMLWLDSDGFATKVWPKDPVAYAIRHRLVLLFDNMKGHNRISHPRVLQTYNKTICGIQLKQGRLETNWVHGDECVGRRIKTVHGFFHVTDLDFYRSDAVARWSENLIGDCFCCREHDDQIAVTVPAALLAPERSRDMRANGLRLDVYHNNRLDGKEQNLPEFIRYYSKVVQHNFSKTVGICRIRASN